MTSTETAAAIRYADAADWWVPSAQTTVREYLYAYRGLLGSLNFNESAEFTATDGHELYACRVTIPARENGGDNTFRFTADLCTGYTVDGLVHVPATRFGSVACAHN